MIHQHEALPITYFIGTARGSCSCPERVPLGVEGSILSDYNRSGGCILGTITVHIFRPAIKAAVTSTDTDLTWVSHSETGFTIHQFQARGVHISPAFVGHVGQCHDALHAVFGAAVPADDMDRVAGGGLLIDPFYTAAAVCVQYVDQFLCIFAGADFVGVLAVFTGSHGNSFGCAFCTILDITGFLLGTDLADIVAVDDLAIAGNTAIGRTAAYISHVVAVRY